MGVRIELADDEALVLFEFLASGRWPEGLEQPERNALQVLEALLQKQLAAPFSQDYATLLEQARSFVLARYGG